jgi:hypothetical protein
MMCGNTLHHGSVNTICSLRRGFTFLHDHYLGNGSLLGPLATVRVNIHICVSVRQFVSRFRIRRFVDIWDESPLGHFKRENQEDHCKLWTAQHAVEGKRLLIHFVCLSQSTICALAGKALFHMTAIIILLCFCPSTRLSVKIP